MPVKLRSQILCCAIEWKIGQCRSTYSSQQKSSFCPRTRPVEEHASAGRRFCTKEKRMFVTRAPDPSLLTCSRDTWQKFLVLRRLQVFTADERKYIQGWDFAPGFEADTHKASLDGNATDWHSSWFISHKADAVDRQEQQGVIMQELFQDL